MHQSRSATFGRESPPSQGLPIPAGDGTAAGAAARRLRAPHPLRGQAADVRLPATLPLLPRLAAIAYFLATTFVDDAPWIGSVDLALGALLVVDFLSRLLSYKRPVRYLETFSALTDVLVILSLFTSFLVENLVFLRTLRLLRAYHTLRQLGRLVPAVRRNEEVVRAVMNVVVYVIMVSSVVYVTQRPINPKIVNFVDALYFTVTSLTTTGYGDIALEGVWGRLLSVAIMISGVSLFLTLVQAVFRPTRVRFQCPQCGLGRHEPDAVHCKACGHLLNIPDEGG
jgi:voltage-gated potassium channel